MVVNNPGEVFHIFGVATVSPPVIRILLPLVHSITPWICDLYGVQKGNQVRPRFLKPQSLASVRFANSAELPFLRNSDEMFFDSLRSGQRLRKSCDESG